MRRLVVGLALIASFAPRTVLAAAGPTPDPQAMQKMLWAPASGTWIEEPPGVTNALEGPFDAQTFVIYAYDDPQSRADVKQRLGEDGFLGGYGRSFHSFNRDQWIDEDVKAFDTVAGATNFWSWVQSWDLPSGKLVAASSVPSSYGDDYTTSAGFHGTEVFFLKGRLMFYVDMGAYTGYMHDQALAHARAVFDYAPTGNAPLPAQRSGQLASTSSATGGSLGLAVVAVVLIALAVCLIGGLVAAIVLTRGRREPPTRTVLSPDGNYWWDGSSWQPVPRA